MTKELEAFELIGSIPLENPVSPQWSYPKDQIIKIQEAMGIIKDALKRNEPMKPKHPVYNQHRLIGLISLCPNCGEEVRGDNYCPDCGQKLDWGK
jgi:ribosomal protein L32